MTTSRSPYQELFLTVIDPSNPACMTESPIISAYAGGNSPATMALGRTQADIQWTWQVRPGPGLSALVLHVDNWFCQLAVGILLSSGN